MIYYVRIVMIPRPNHYPKESVPMFTPNDLIDIAAKMEKNG